MYKERFPFSEVDADFMELSPRCQVTPRLTTSSRLATLIVSCLHSDAIPTQQDQRRVEDDATGAFHLC